MASILNVDKIRRAAGSTDALVIDSGDRVTTPTRPAFSVSLSSGLTAGFNNVIAFNTVNTNVGSHYDTTNKRFVAPIAGLYYFSFSSLACGTSSGGLLPAATAASARIELSTDSGSNYSGFVAGYTYLTSTTSYPNISSSGTIELAAGNYVRLNISHAYAYTDGSGNYDPRFSGFLIG